MFQHAFVGFAVASVLITVDAPVHAAPRPSPAALIGANAPTAVPDRYIVVLKDGASAAARNSVRSGVVGHGATIRHEYTRLLNGFSAKMSAEGLSQVRRDPRVAYVEQVQTAQGDQDQTSPPSWGLDRIDQQNLPLNNIYQYHASGHGVRAYILDSGIRRTHREFTAGRVAAGWDFVDNDGDPADCHGHGTHVAGTVGGATAGVAKQVTIVPLRVLKCNNLGDSDDIVAALDWVAVQHPAGVPAVVNMSVGFEAVSIDDAVRYVVATRRIPVVAAAGNDNADACLQTPARVPMAITVGATTNVDARWSSSNWGSCVDLFAPGANIQSASHTDDTNLISKNGTSMAAPHVTGVVAAYLQTNPTASPQQVVDALVNASTKGKVTSPGTGSPNRLLYRIPAAPGTATPNTSLNGLFNNYGNNAGCADWSGADGTQSLQLPSGKRAWFFADTFLNSPAERPGGFYRSTLRNSIVIQNGTSLRTITGGNTCRERDTTLPFWDRYANTSFTDPTGNGYYWPGDSMVVGSNVVKFLYRNVPEGQWWTDTHSAVVTIPLSTLENSSVINIQPTLLPPVYSFGTHPINWGLSLLQQGSTVYIYGAGIVNAGNSRRLYLARAATADLTNPSRWAYYNGSGWSAAGNQAAARPVSPDLKVENGFSVVEVNGWYWLIQHEPGLSGGGIVAHPAATPNSFGTRGIVLYTPPEGPRDAAHKFQFYYEARAHAGLGAPGRIVVSYNVNTSAVSVGCRGRNNHDADIYRPRFIDVPTHMFQEGMARTPPVPLGTAGSEIYRPGIHGGRLADARSAGTTAAGRTDAALMADNAWYDGWAAPQEANGGCPPLTQPTTLTASAAPNGHVSLNWTDYGRDMWYWIYSRDATANEPFVKRELWSSSLSTTMIPVMVPERQGHTFEWYVVPFARGASEADNNGDGRPDQDAPKSNTARLTVNIAAPAKVTGVTTTRLPGARIGISWSAVTFPSSNVYYFVDYWKPLDGQTEQQASRVGPISPDFLATEIAFSTGDFVEFRVRAQNIGGFGPPSDVVSEFAGP